MDREIDYQVVPKLSSQLQETWESFAVARDASLDEIAAAVAAEAGVPVGTEMKMLIGNKWKDIQSSTPLPGNNIKFKILDPQGRLPHRHVLDRTAGAFAACRTRTILM